MPQNIFKKIELQTLAFTECYWMGQSKQTKQHSEPIMLKFLLSTLTVYQFINLPVQNLFNVIKPKQIVSKFNIYSFALLLHNKFKPVFSSYMDHRQQPREIKCNQGLFSRFSCINQECQKYAFVCQKQSCECRKQHKKCLLIMTQTLLQNMSTKIVPIKQLQDSIQNQIDKLIDQLSDLKDKLMCEIQTKLQHFGLRKKNKQLLKLINYNKLQSITGSQIWNSIIELKTPPNILSVLQQQTSNINNLLKKCKQQIDKQIIQIFPLIERLKLISQNHFQCFFLNSRVINQPKQRQNILFFFGTKNIKSAELLYRASQNQFKVEKCRQKCDNIAHTLLVCETEFSKKIGGYTPIPWQKTNCTQIADNSGQSFIFSLTHNQKFDLCKQSYAVVHRNDKYCMQFGPGDILIIDKANQNGGNYGNINQSYVNKNYKQSHKQSYQRFSGNPNNSYQYKTKEWQVWKLQFE